MVKPTTTTTTTTSGRPTERSDYSRYRGIRKRKWGKWVSEIRKPNSRERIWLGSYDKPEKAARAFDAAVFCLRGRNAKFNFPEDPPEIEGGESFSPPEIRAAAARFANEKEQKDSNSDNLPTESQSEYPSSSSISNAMVPEPPFMDFIAMGSGEGVPELGSFSGLDDYYSNEYFPPLPSFDYGEENEGGSYHQHSFLWNF